MSRKAFPKSKRKTYTQSADSASFLRHSMAGIQGTSEKISGIKLLSRSEKIHMASWGKE